jgi:hypothetical protein
MRVLPAPAQTPAREITGCRQLSTPPFNQNMGNVIRTVLMLAAAGGVYVWLTATVPGGEKRYEHYIREAKDRVYTGGL